MPSQITHFLFAKEIIEQGLPKKGPVLTEKFKDIVGWFSQGPDIFYHNQRSRPGSFKYGRIIHRGGYDRILFHLMRQAPGKGDPRFEKYKAASFSFLSHALLDRRVHPFIIYFSGWREPGNRETDHLYRMHPFFERIIDVLLYEKIVQKNLHSFDFYHVIETVQGDFDFCSSFYLNGIIPAYPDLNKPDLDKIRFRNAFNDALFFYRAVNPLNRGNVQFAYQRDKDNNFSRKFLALYYPKWFSRDIDYLNTGHEKWNDPFVQSIERSESFIDLYEEAVRDGAEIIKKLNHLLESEEFTELTQGMVTEIIGGGNLSNGTLERNPAPVVSFPLPLHRELVREYKKVENEFGLDQVFVDK